MTACPAGPHRSELDLADRYQRGDGVPRDFRKAAEILERRCDDGRGDLAACARFAAAVIDARGVSRDRDLVDLAVRACRRGAWLLCGEPIASLDVPAAERACERGQPEACLAVANGPGRSEGDLIELVERACDGGVLTACLQIVQTASAHDAAAAERARRHASTQCDRGDVDACIAVGRPIDPRVRCDAGDYAACATAAGDDVALTVACDHGVLAGCELLAFGARDADPPDPHASEKMARACKLGSSGACRHNRPADLATGCVAYQPTVFVAAERARVPRLSGIGPGGQPWRAEVGKPYVLIAQQRDVPWARFDDVARRLTETASVYVMVPDAAVVPADAAARGFVPDRALFTASVTRTVRVADRSIKVVDGDGAVRAILSTEFPIVPATFARCVAHLLE